jgi:hypothetical protein
MIDEFVKSIKATLYDRTTSPLFGAFAISWLAWNYKLIVVLLSSMSAQAKFAFIEQQLYGDWRSGLLILGVYPLVTSAAFLFVYPYPARFVYQFWHTQQRTLRNVKQKIDDEALLSVEESRRVRRELTEIQTEYEGQLQRARNETTRLKQALAAEQEARGKAERDLVAVKGELPTRDGERVIASDDDLASWLKGRRFRLFFSPDRGMGGSKAISFAASGLVNEGQNDNEHRWEVRNRKLEMYRKDGVLQSRFDYLPDAGILLHTADADAASGSKGQYIVTAS